MLSQPNGETLRSFANWTENLVTSKLGIDLSHLSIFQRVKIWLAWQGLLYVWSTDWRPAERATSPESQARLSGRGRTKKMWILKCFDGQAREFHQVWAAGHHWIQGGSRILLDHAELWSHFYLSSMQQQCLHAQPRMEPFVDKWSGKEPSDSALRHVS